MLALSTLGEEPWTFQTPIVDMDIDMGRPAPGTLRVSSGWEDGRRHPGIDILMPVGTPLWAVQDGVVITADSNPEGDAGRWVAIQHRNGWVSRSMHLSRVDVRVGQAVRKGEQIGLSGNTGRSSGPHLHLDLKLKAEWLPSIEAAVGRVRTGYISKMDGRTGVPAEPWIPVDSYRDDVISRARKNAIPLYHERRRQREQVAQEAAGAWAGIGTVFAVAGVAVGLAGVAALIAKVAGGALAARAPRRV